MGEATAVTLFHPTGDDAFAELAEELTADAHNAKGIVAVRVSDCSDPRLDEALAVTFASEDLLHRWLDSPDRAAVLRGGQARGCRHRSLT
jgi:uncharacterized protein